MLIEQGTVLNYCNGVATIQCNAKSSCGSCNAQNSCGTKSLSGLVGDKQLLLELKVTEVLQEGDIIEIGLKEQTLLIAVMWLYCIPLILLILSIILFSQIFTNELLIAILSFLITLISFGVIKWKLNHKQYFIPQAIFLGKVK
ncbi:SoxR reducing system RseC family protein [Pasteurella skyensis]|uniref:SoxR reducing system RseC family protein n=1 Tax=Phocoenobacter skyensis TaxID=97481 RepID=A0AAJ6NAA1_9PAST|nr:SoxR reducing system RseC family protein [Pasteurella skyensis]MDP8163098.1 SoxR reducing system RseC family protein [Pasteurella skyensis]MDP8173081.1 SoxR reducing system RseC family protein [Pasteurella skyensis]MDP8177179.1 SoxR reducing system RseC family protein [Pasteurella skyensis]MDP8179643.1 SoxR reducing system RseC family protein [Pasteurella skyensis]MDP8183832.1 SoxR reducing system RseC family protein [Pasteurella skyensis]